MTAAVVKQKWVESQEDILRLAATPFISPAKVLK